MATSPAMSTSNDRVKYKITITQNSQNVNNNTSNVTVSVRFYRTNTGYTTYGSGTVYCKINGTTYSAAVTPSQKITNSGIVLFTKTLNISHNADGTKTLQASAWINLNTPLTSNEQSYSQALTTIPRATTPTLSASSVALGGSVTISLPRAASSFTHTLTYKFGSASGTIGSNLGTSASWSPPLTLANQIPNTTSGVVTITCTTYNGSTKISTKSVTITVTVPASVVPTISSIAVSEGVSGLNAKIGAFVQGQSKINVTITAAGAYGSSVTTYISKFGSSSFNGASFSIENVNSSGSVTLSVTVTDSRGRKTTKNQTVTVLAYQIPKIVAFTGIRCNQDGTANEDGQYVKLAYNYTISALNNKNDKTITIAYRQVGASSYTTLKTESNYSANTTYVPSTVFSVDNSYEFKITVQDYFKTVSYELEVTTAFTLVDYSAGGHGMAIGKVAESEDLFEVALPTRFNDSLQYPNNILWTGVYYMNGNQTATLSDLISNQASGVVLIFSRYVNGAADDSAFCDFFIPKEIVAQKPGKGHSFILTSSNFGYIASKYLYINDGSIAGHANNTTTGTANGITYANNAFVLRYVIGV